ncbi:2872_t:CDS:10 [Paraglomus occultum]|uniref:Exocyst complex component EXO84 n=1 Tax=Paraglomus occultum TaxID=144539 RepID=A0A9N8WC03_9GLOM|nr:2872_t:CDS:10 [Paraglomus occultum]
MSQYSPQRPRRDRPPFEVGHISTANVGTKAGGTSPALSPSSPTVSRESAFLSWRMNRSAGNLLKQLEGKRGGEGVGYAQFDDEQRGEVPGVELKEFAAEDYNPEAYIAKTLANATEEGVRVFYDKLRESKDVAATVLQKNVYENYNEFVTISKEISNILALTRTISDMLVLRSFLNELRNVSDNLREDSTVDSVTTDSVISVAADPIISRSRKPVTNNAADLQAIWKAQIEALWENVEGAQALVPFQRGRHVIREISSFVEINPKSNKLKQGVQMFLLTDCLLVANKRKQGMSMRVKLVADKCWPLNEITIIDMKDTSEHENIIKILKHPVDTFLYKCGKPEEKMTLISMAKRAAEVMMLVKSNGGEQRNSDTMLPIDEQKLNQSANNSSRRGRSMLEPSVPSTPMPRTPLSGTRDAHAMDPREIEDLMDQLDVFIALREFDEAVDSIKKLKSAIGGLQSDPIKMESLRSKVDERVVRLSDAISRDLTTPDIKKAQMQKSVKLLLRLGYGEQARRMFLTARSGIIRIRTRQLKFEGDIPQYINELSLVYFTLIKNTCAWYNSAFKDTRMASGLVKWAKEEMERYADMFRRQVYTVRNQDEQTVEKCLRCTRQHCSILTDVGLDLRFLLESLLQPSKGESRDSEYYDNEDDDDFLVTYVVS